MELFMILTGVTSGLAGIFFFMWRGAVERAADAEALAEDLLQTNAELQKSYDEMKNRYWKVLVEGKKFDEGGGAQGALDEGWF